jgi:beta-ribofuranosylaminobenzene 5'-phosphate synthase
MASVGGLGVVVVAPAHLHAGNMDLTGDLGRLYGTAGFTIDYPRTVIEAYRSDRITITGEEKENAARYISAFMERFNVEGGITVNIKETIPKHLGLGSQTTLALSIGLALSALYALPTNIEEMAIALGRSEIVALGLYSFKTGGFIVDGGYRIKEKGRAVPPLLFRHPIPEDWLFVICIPHEPIPAILKIKENEEEILNNLKPMPEQISDRLSRIMLMQVMPSIMEHDITTFGKSITAFNSRLGDFWGEFQEGCTYCHPVVERGIELLLDNGAYGACQSCWGPTFYGIVNNGETARELVEELKRFMENKGGGDVFYTTGNNQGASINGVPPR